MKMREPRFEMQSGVTGYEFATRGGDKPTSVLCCRYQHALGTRASVTCNMYIHFSFLSIVFLLVDRKKKSFKLQYIDF